jgi:hypothetical protein
LPDDRYNSWRQHGRHWSGSIAFTLSECGFADERTERIEQALLEIEPFPSRA